MTELIDRHETVALMEPLRVPGTSRHRAGITDLAMELAAKSAALRSSLPEGIVTPLSELVRSMNCYYSNLIEGHDTHPVDIERALRGDFSNNAEQRNLQLEAKAHIAVQTWIDEGGLHNRAFSQSGIRNIHERFCTLLPNELLSIPAKDSKTFQTVVPGHYRETDVQVGRHIAISPGAIQRFMERYENTYSALGTSESIISAAAAHHRLLWIHPFTDGNGRVARLMSHAVLSEHLDTGSIWSISRGLARNEQQYKSHLASCDLPRRNDLDGRGNLSEESLASFTRFFLKTCIDQVEFMKGLVQPEQLLKRILAWCQSEIEQGNLPSKSRMFLEALLYRGEIFRGDIPSTLDTSERTGRRIVSALTERGVISSENKRAPLHLSFPAELAPQWMPGLFPESAG